MRYRRTSFALLAAALTAALIPSPAAAALIPGSDAAAPAPFVDEQVLYQQRTGGYACFRIPAVVRTVSGTLLAFAEGRVADCGDDGDIDLVVRRSTDGGRTWGPVQVVAEGNGDTIGNPAPVVDRTTGRVVVVGTRNGPAPCPNGCDRDPYVLSSDDDGVTWTAPRELGDAKRPEWNFWYATGPMHGIQLERGPHAGRLVVGANFESYAGGESPHVYGTHLLYSDDAGQTWHIGAETSRADGTIIAQEVTVVERTDGSIYALARERGTDEGHRAFAVSRDGGETFAAPFRALPALEMPDVEASMLRYDGSRILLSAPLHPVAREVMAVRSSFDEGGSWRQPKVFNWGPSGYSDLVRLEGDEAGLLYENGVATPYESIRWARFNEAYLATPNGTPPNIPPPPAPGPVTADRSPAHNPAYVRGGAATVPGRFGSALALDRVDDYVEVPFDPSIDAGAGDFTMAAWINYTATTGSHAILWAYRTGSGTTPQVWLRAEPASNRIRALIMVDRFNVTVASTSAYNDGQWHFVVLRRAGGTLRLAVDGVTAAEAAAPPGSVTAGKEFGVYGIHVGQRVDGADRFLGAIDEVRMYRRALSEQELTLLRERNLPIGGRLGLWLPFEAVG
ncbi:sialidase family protein [Dactylosporangium sp. AC04546]|uniref:sialidase family protein n=1 Tax=Dactylosporangium sp. AC04546 TaxID=2862460 RepID=UPI001EDF0992|nr:sialidase family protein [Dactylosporangium sp. AC04546]WVK88077.1 sialidase family protein [Dactylosporangium sp. AC04546]